MSERIKNLLVGAFIAGFIIAFLAVAVMASLERADAIAKWHENVRAAGCKRVGYLDPGGHRALWRCPDGNVYLEPRQ